MKFDNLFDTRSDGLTDNSYSDVQKYPLKALTSNMFSAVFAALPGKISGSI